MVQQLWEDGDIAVIIWCLWPPASMGAPAAMLRGLSTTAEFAALWRPPCSQVCPSASGPGCWAWQGIVLVPGLCQVPQRGGRWPWQGLSTSSVGAATSPGIGQGTGTILCACPRGCSFTKPGHGWPVGSMALSPSTPSHPRVQNWDGIHHFPAQSRHTRQGCVRLAAAAVHRAMALGRER